MKLRCKLLRPGGGGNAATVALTLPQAGATLADLLAAVGAHLGGRTVAANELSLNGTDPLVVVAAAGSEATTETPLAALGLVSGDLLFVRCSGSATAAVTELADTSPALGTEATGRNASSSGTTVDTSFPLLVGEISSTTASATSAAAALCPSLRMLLRLHCPQPADAAAAASTGLGGLRLRHLALALHCLMVETGFVAVDPTTGQSQSQQAGHAGSNNSLAKYLLLPSSLPEDMATASYTLHYRYRLLERQEEESANTCCVLLKVVQAARLAICHCAVRHEQQQDQEQLLSSASTQCSLDRFVPETGGYANLRQLSVHFKDSIAERAKSTIHEACGLPLRGLAGLPAELLLRILRCCHAAADVCSLGRTCRRLRLLHDDNYVWRALLHRDFRHKAMTQDCLAAERQGQEVSYYSAYQRLYLERIRRSRMLVPAPSRELVPLDFGIPIVAPPPQLRPPFLPPERPDFPLGRGRGHRGFHHPRLGLDDDDDEN